MAWLNYHHLLYFWTVVREGSISAASRMLRLAQPTVSGQIKALEESLGVQLFRRQGSRLVPTEAGAHVYRYADEIFSLGRELLESLAGRASVIGRRLVVGVADVVPKLIAQRLIAPALGLGPQVRLLCLEDRQERLLGELSTHALDLVLTDSPVPPGSSVRAVNHLLGETGLSLFAPRRLAEKLRRQFPGSLEGAPLLLPTEETGSRRALNRYLDEHRVRPAIRGEFQDTALLTAFGQAGIGAFPAPSVLSDEICRQYHVERVATLEGVTERFYALTVERRLSHPGVRAIVEAARTELFA